MTWTSDLISLDACSEAIEWAETQPDLATAWAVCERGDWMLWLIGRTTKSAPWSEERKPLVACALDCAALALPYASDRGAIADEMGVIRAWTRGEATKDQAAEARRNLWRIYSYVIADAPDAAAYAAYAAADAAYAAAADAAYAAAADAAAAAAAAYAAYAAADAAAVSAYAAVAAARAAHTRVLKQCADIVRTHFPTPPSFARKAA
jgi:hypothetical protein